MDGYQGQTAAIGKNAARERDNNCIEVHLKNIEAELAESLNSAENLADKLRGQQENVKSPGGQAPQPSDITGRLSQIVNTIRCLNSQLGRGHAAISG